MQFDDNNKNMCDVRKTNVASKESFPAYDLKAKDSVIRDRQEQYNYLKYRDKYKSAVGVYPEFDKINNPVCAVVHGNVIYPDDLDKTLNENNKKGALQILTAGVRGGLEALDHGKAPWEKTVSEANNYISDDASNLATLILGKNSKFYLPFKIAFKKTIEKYKFLYSAIASFDVNTIIDMEPCTCFSSASLGYRKLENGIYAEGTWKDGKFVYGLCYHPTSGLCAGYFKNERMTDGVWLNENGVWSIGNFNEDGEFECSQGIRIFSKGDNASDTKMMIQAGSFLHNRENGFVFEYVVSNGNVVNMYDTKYDFGEEVKMTFAEKKQRKALYGSSKGDRIMAYYRGIMFIIVGIIVGAVGFGLLTEVFTGGMFALALAFIFLFFGIKSCKWAAKQSKMISESNK